MYERFYGFEERPFTLLPDPDFLFLSEKHQTALDLLELAVLNCSGFCVISGEIGAGKTTLIRELLNRLDERISVGLVSNTHESFGELLQWIMAAYGQSAGGSDKLELHKRFIDYTIEQYAANRHTLLIIDEAQNLSMPALEELRMLSNVNSDKHLVLQIILVGQQQLRDKLKDPGLEQFSQRIALDYHLDTLNEEETRRYIQHRLVRAGSRRDLFSDSACLVVYRVTDGIPRLINRICDLSLVYGYSNEAPRITAEIVEQVAEDQRMGSLFGDRGVPVDDEVHQPVTLKAVAGGQGPKARRAGPSSASKARQPVIGESRSAASGTSVEPKEPARQAVADKQDVVDGTVSESGKSARPGIRQTVPDQAGEIETPVPGDELVPRESSTEDIGGDAQEHEPVHIPAGTSGPVSAAPEEGKAPGIAEESLLPAKHKNTAAGNRVNGPDTIVNAMNSSMLQLQKPAHGKTPDPDVEHEPSKSDMADDLHTLIVSSERQQPTKGERGALWLMIGVLTMVGGTAWMMRDNWSEWHGAVAQKQISEPVALPAEHDPGVGPAAIAATAPARKATAPASVFPSSDAPKKARPVEVAASRELPPATTPAIAQQARPVESTAALESGKRLVRREDGTLVEAETKAGNGDGQRARDAELQREAERLALLKQEAQRLEKERRAAERQLAQQRAAREALERKARIEKKRIQAAREAVEQVAVEREHVAKKLSQVTRPVVIERTPVEPVAAEPLPIVAEPPAVPVAAAEAPVASLEPLAVEQPPIPADAEPKNSGEIQFSNNPCQGPTARFMSTCR